jgi:hypothetical protein
MFFGPSRFAKARGDPLGISSLFKGAGSKISSTIGNFGKRLINDVGPMFISRKLGQLADKTGITDVIGKDAVKTGTDFVRKGLTGNLV